MKPRITLFLLLAFVAFIGTIHAQTLDSAFFAGMKARSIGPAGMSGRIAAIEVVVANPDIIYVGAAMGGVWKSTSGGTTWIPIFDNESTAAIGSIAVFQANPDVVWVGTGEGNPRNSAGVGRGIFKSLDGGKTWRNMGLEKSERIHRIITHPTNPDVVYVAALGPEWGDGTERGVFKTTDGGKTWRKVLYTNERTGAGDLAVDPANPNHLIVGLWEYRRQPWFFTSGGSGSGVYTSNDGGETWKKLTNKDGLPEGELGRSGIAFAPSNPNVVYALVEAKESALLRSDDGGVKWRTVNKEKTINPRPFYFCDIRVHPKTENTIFRLQVDADISTDGGRTFQTWLPNNTVHADHHALWIHPNGDFFLNGNDGGVTISRDGGKKFQFVDNLPVGQFYHVATDNEFPYNVYGGLQDNGSWRGPSTSLKSDGIYNAQWEAVLFGDGFATVPDPENSEFGYAMSQGGALAYFNYKTGVRKNIRPTETDVKHRYNWNTGIAIDPIDKKTVYYGSQFLHKSSTKGASWELISPDLTTNDATKQKSTESGGITRDVTAAENYCTILSIAPSPVKQETIWVSTDDGNLQLTQDGGKTWSNVSPANNKTVKVTGAAANLPPQGAWSPHVEASTFDAATAFVVFDDHRRSNWGTYVFVTHDYGKTWTSLATSEIDGFCHVIRQDPVAENLLFLGTEFGLYVSVNGGKNWTKWKAGLPTVSVQDMVVHKREHDLVIGTHGRAMFILDDIRPLRTVSQEIAKKELHLFEIGKAYQYTTQYWAGSYFGQADGLYRGESRRYGAFINYVMNPPDSVIAKEGTPKEQKLDIQILSLPDSAVIRTVKGTMRKGINRVAWDLRRKGFDTPGNTGRRGGAAGAEDEQADRPGILVLPGKYAVKMKYGKMIAIQEVEVAADPRVVTTPEAIKQNYSLQMKAGSLMETMTKAVKQITETKKVIKAITADFAKNVEKAKADSLAKSGKALEKKLDSLMYTIVPDESRSGIYDRSAELSAQVGEVLFGTGGSFDAPTQAAQVKYDKVKTILGQTLKAINDVYASDVAKFKQDVETAGFSIWGKIESIIIKE